MGVINVGIYLFDEVELLDFAGPLEVFTAADYVLKGKGYDVTTVAQSKVINVSKSNLKVNCAELLDAHKGYDLFLIPGGMGTRDIIKDQALLTILDEVIKNSTRVATVCTGSLILAQLGHLKNQRATSHHLAIDLLQKLEPSCQIINKRYIDNDRYVISAGVSAGIDMSFHIVEQNYGIEVKSETAKYMEYDLK